MQIPPMSMPSLPHTSVELAASKLVKPEQAGDLSAASEQQAPDELKQAFQDFVGQTLFSQMIKAVRSTQQAAPYFHGGRAEEIFQGQLDQVLSEEISESSAAKISDPMFELFMMRRQG